MASVCRAIWLATVALTTTIVAAAQDVQPALFETSDGVHIAGDFYPAPHSSDAAPFVILLHMYESDRTAWAPLIPRLRETGFAVLAIDLRGHGQSGTHAQRDRAVARDDALFASMDLDVWAAYDWIVTQPGIDRARFALVGASVGASVALRYATLDRSVDAVVCLTPGLHSMGLDSRADVEKLKGRRLLMLATDDEADAAKELAKLNRGAKAKTYKGAAHGTHMLDDGHYAERDIIEFLREAVGKPSANHVYGSIQRDIYHLPGSGWVDRISATNLRHYSSREEAESRGLRASKSTGPADQARRRKP